MSVRHRRAPEIRMWLRGDQPQTPDERAGLALLTQELHVPPGATLWRFGVLYQSEAAPHWHNVVVTMFGLPISWPYSVRDTPPPWPHMQLVEDDDVTPISTWQLWCQMAHPIGLPCWAERRWSPMQGQHDMVRIQQDMPRPTDYQILAAWRAFAAIDRLPPSARGGRPTKDPEIDRVLFTRIVRDLRAAGKVGTEEQVAEELDREPSRSMHAEKSTDPSAVRVRFQRFWPASQGTWKDWIASLAEPPPV